MAQTNNDYDALFDYYGKQYDVDPRLGKTVFHIESSGNPATRDSPQGAQGGMQMEPATAASLGVTDPRDMKQAIPAAMEYLSQGLKQTGTPQGALAYYHGGPDTSQWGPKTRDYVTNGLAAYPRMAVAPANDTNAITPDADFNSRWGLNPSQAVPSPVPVAPDDFNKRWGIVPESPAVTGTPARPDIPTMVVRPTPVAGDPTVALNALGGDQWAPTHQAPNPLSTAYQATTNALAPAPNTTYGNVIPFARDNATGALRPALPDSLRNLAQGGADLTFGPGLGTVTPQATAALTNLVPGLMPAPARGTGLALATATAPRPPAPSPAPAFEPNPLASPAVAQVMAPDFVPPGTSVSPLLRIRQLIDADNAVAANRPDFIPPGAPQPPNPLSRAPETVPAGSVRTNPLDTTPVPVPESVAAPADIGMTAQEAAENAVIPEKLPPAPLLPPLTQGAADARADQLVKHFSAGKPVSTDLDIVPGYMPKLSGLTNDPGIATLERGVQAVHPGSIGLRDQNNQTAINNFTTKLIGDPSDPGVAEAARDAITDPLREDALSNAGPVDLSSVKSAANSILSGPEGKRAAVKTSVNDVLKSLHVGEDTNNETETNADMVYGIRKNLNDLLSPVSQKENPQLQQASRALMQVKDKLDDALIDAAPGMDKYLDTYSALSQPIDAQKYLQSLNLTDPSGDVRLSSIDAAIKQIQKQQNMPGIQKATWVSPDQLGDLQTLRNTLRMNQFSGKAGKTLGSNTFQNLATNSIAGQVMGNPLVAVGTTGLGALGGGTVGAMAAAGANIGIHSALARSETMVRDALIRRLLNHQGTGAAALGAGQ